MRVLVLTLLFCLPGCGLVSRYAGDVELPTSETQQIVTWASWLPRWDIDQNGMIDAQELDAFLTWFGSQIIFTYALQPPQAPPTAPPATKPVPDPS